MTIKRYKLLCRIVDKILDRSKVRKLCSRCYVTHPSCCVGCEYLSGTLEDSPACKTLSLGCKLWFCDGDYYMGWTGGRNMQSVMELDSGAVKRLRKIFEEGSREGVICPRCGLAEIERGEWLDWERYRSGFKYLL